MECLESALMIWSLLVTVETITGAYDRIKEKYGLKLVDTMSIFNNLGAEEMKTYYNDTIHPKQEGHIFISKFVAEKLK